MNYFQLLKRLYDIYDRNVGKTVDAKYITRQVRQAIPFSECTITSIQTLSIANNQFEVAGMYDSEADEYGEKCITVEIAFPAIKPEFVFCESDLSRDHWSQFCIDFALIVGHEYMHLNQFRRRDFKWSREYKSKHPAPKVREVQRYYGDADEIDAYAFTAAAEMAINFIPENKKPIIETTPLYQTYTKYFDKQDPVVLKFVKLTERYFKRLERQYHATKFE